MPLTSSSPLSLVLAGACIAATSMYLIQKRRSKSSAFDLSTFQLEQIIKVMDSEMCVVGTFPGSAEKALLILQKQKFARGDANRLVHNMILRQVHANDVYSNHIGVLSGDNDALRVTVIYPATASHIAKHTEQMFDMIVETKDIYEKITLPYIESIPPQKIQWVYNILERKSETEKLIFEDSDPSTGFVLLPDTKWSPPFHIENLYCLAIVMDRSIRSIRDLRRHHIELLTKIRDTGMDVIAKKYNVAKTRLRCFVHYQPSYYHFHVHFTHIKVPFGIFVGKAIMLEDIIHNLGVDDDYYANATLSFVVGASQHDVLYKSLMAASTNNEP